MKIKEVVARALMLAGRADAAHATEEDGALSGEAAEAQKTALYCVNAAEDELARFYFPLTYAEVLPSSGGKFAFSRFKYYPVRIISVKRNGREIAYTVNPADLAADADSVEVTYAYVPKKKGLSDDSEFGDMLGAEIPALGAAAEYCLINGEISLSSALEERYRLAIDKARIISDCPDIPPRRWV